MACKSMYFYLMVVKKYNVLELSTFPSTFCEFMSRFVDVRDLRYSHRAQTNHQIWGGGGGVRGPLLETLALFQTKICHFKKNM